MTGIELTPEVPVARVASLAARAEAAGFDSVFASGHYNNRDPWIALAAAVETTDAVALGPGVVNPYDAHPVTLAGRAATLQEAAGGRCVLGLGAGDRSTLANLGVDRDRPLRRVLETIRVARRLWAGERVTHDGTFVARDAGLNFDVRPPPVWVGAQGPDMLRMAATHADGALVNASHERDVAWAADRLAEGLGGRPADAGGFASAAFASVSVARDGEAAREAARPPVAFIAAGADDRVLERHDLDRDRAREIGAAIEAGRFGDAFDRVTPGMLAAFCVAGTPDEVADRLAGLREHVDDVVVGSPLGPDREAAIDLLGEALAL